MTFVDSLHSQIQDRVSRGYRAAGYPVYDMSRSDAKKIEEVANKYGFPAQWLANLINFETAGTFNPAIQNYIGATGLIQFLRSTAENMGTSTTALAQMSFSDQMNYVDKYLKNYFTGTGAHRGLYNPSTGKVTNKFTQVDLFMIIFYPAATGNPDFTFPSAVSAANNGILRPEDYAKKALAAATAPFRDFPGTLSMAGQFIRSNSGKIIGIAIGMLGVSTLLFFTLRK